MWNSKKADINAMAPSLHDDVTSSESESETPRAPLIMNPDIGQILPTRLRPRSNPSGTSRAPWKPRPVINADGQKEYRVEQVRGKKMIDRKLYYELKWTGYDSDENTWEPMEFLTNAMKMVKEYEASLVQPIFPPTPSESESESTVSESGAFYLNKMGPLYRHVWDPSERPIAILAISLHNNTLLHLVKIAPADSEVEPQTREQLLEDVNDSNVVVVRASTMAQTFPQLTINYYESGVKFVDKAKSPKEMAEDAARAVILQKGSGHADFNGQEALLDMMPEDQRALGGDADWLSGHGRMGNPLASKEMLSKNESAARNACDQYGLPMYMDSSSISSSSDGNADADDESDQQPPVKKLKKKLGLRLGRLPPRRRWKRVLQTWGKSKQYAKGKNKLAALSESDIDDD